MNASQVNGSWCDWYTRLFTILLGCAPSPPRTPPRPPFSTYVFFRDHKKKKENERISCVNHWNSTLPLPCNYKCTYFCPATLASMECLLFSTKNKINKMNKNYQKHNYVENSIFSTRNSKNKRTHVSNSYILWSLSLAQSAHIKQKRLFFHKTPHPIGHTFIYIISLIKLSDVFFYTRICHHSCAINFIVFFVT